MQNSEAPKRQLWELQSMQAAPLSVKIALTKDRIREWVNQYGEDGVYVSFSGGKDSTVLLTIAREMFPSIKGVYVDTGLEYSEVRNFVRTWDNVEWLKPKLTFKQVIEKYGYPFISKEVAECVYAAKKYLTEVLTEQNLDRQTDRQTDRQRHKWHYQKYRQLCGLAEYAKPRQRQKVNASAGENVGDACEGRELSDSGEYP